MTRSNPDALPPGTLLHWYRIDSVLGQGGFGLTYLATDTNLQQQVAIKEYLPVECATRLPDGSVLARSDQLDDRYAWGLERFVSEAQVLAQFDHPSIVRVHSVFEYNNTAYMVMRYEQGENLEGVLGSSRALDEESLLALLMPVLDGLEAIHAKGFIHRDIKPDNIYVRDDGSPVLIDFGSARQPAGATRMLTILVAPGYAPFEQYYETSSQQGPWTDIYSLGATLYRVVAGQPPADAIARSRGVLGRTRDILVPAVDAGRGRYSQRFLAAIDRALCFNEADRPQNIAQWRSCFHADADSADSQATDPAPASAVTAAPAPLAAVPRDGSPLAPGRGAPGAVLGLLLTAAGAGAGYLAAGLGAPDPVPVAAPAADAGTAAAAEERRRLQALSAELTRRQGEVERANTSLTARRREQEERAAALSSGERDLAARQDALASAEASAADEARELERRRSELDRREAEQVVTARDLEEARAALQREGASRDQVLALRETIATLERRLGARATPARSAPAPAPAPAPPPAAAPAPAPHPAPPSLDDARASLRAGDTEAAKRQLGELAAAGIAEAHYLLGTLQLDDKAAPELASQGIESLRKAAAGGFAEAHRHLGELYARGRSVARDDFLAYMWLWAATELGSGGARELMDEVGRRLQPMEVEQARRTATQNLVAPARGRK